MSLVSLLDAPLNASLTVRRVDIDPALQQRCAQMGLGVGSRIRLVMRTAGGGRLIQSGPSQVALDRATCRSVQVSAASAPQVEHTPSATSLNGASHV